MGLYSHSVFSSKPALTHFIQFPQYSISFPSTEELVEGAQGVLNSLGDVLHQFNHRWIISNVWKETEHDRFIFTFNLLRRCLNARAVHPADNLLRSKGRESVRTEYVIWMTDYVPAYGAILVITSFVCCSYCMSVIFDTSCLVTMASRWRQKC